MDYPSFTDSTMEVLFVVDPAGIEPASAILQVTPIYDNHHRTAVAPVDLFTTGRASGPKPGCLQA